MVKFLYILFILIFSSFSIAKTSDENTRLFFPKFIPVNSIFDVSLVTSNNYPEADKLILYISSDTKTTLNNIFLRSMDLALPLQFITENSGIFFDKSYKITMDLKAHNITSGMFFQLLSSFKSENQSSGSIKFYGEFKKDDKTLGYLKSSEVEKSLDEKILTANLKFYKPQKSAGKSLLFSGDSKLQLNSKQTLSENIVSEFWIKFDNAGQKFLGIIEKNSGKILYEFLINPFQMISVISHYNQETISPFFISKNNWYHFSINFSNEDKIFSLFIDGNLVVKFKQNDNNFEDFLITFFSSEKEKSFQIDLLRFINFSGSTDAAFANRHYLNFRAENSSVLSSFRFDSNSDFSKNDFVLENYGTQFIRSDAPIFARAPELNINPLSTTYELVWSGGDYKQAASYHLERSKDNSEFTQIFTTQPENSTEKRYSFLDQKDEQAEVIYYRVKQINNDGSVVYSSQVKIGQGITEPFLLDQNFPNPFNPKTSIKVDLIEDTELEIIIYNLEGREITTIQKGKLAKGSHIFTFDGAELPSGIYLYKVSTPTYSTTRKMILAK